MNKLEEIILEVKRNIQHKTNAKSEENRDTLNSEINRIRNTLMRRLENEGFEGNEQSIMERKINDCFDELKYIVNKKYNQNYENILDNVLHSFNKCATEIEDIDSKKNNESYDVKKENVQHKFNALSNQIQYSRDNERNTVKNEETVEIWQNIASIVADTQSAILLKNFGYGRNSRIDSYSVSAIIKNAFSEYNEVILSISKKENNDLFNIIENELGDFKKYIENKMEKEIHKNDAEILKQSNDELKKQEKLETKRQVKLHANIQEERPNKLETERQAKLEVERQAQLEAEKQAKLEAERQAKLEAERQAQLEAERQAKLEAERQAKLEAEKQAKLEAEKQAKLEAERQAKLEAEKQAKLEAERQAKLEAEKQAKLEAEKQAQIEAENQKQNEIKSKKEEYVKKQQDFIFVNAMQSYYEKYGENAAIEVMLKYINTNNINCITSRNNAREQMQENKITGSGVANLLHGDSTEKITESSLRNSLRNKLEIIKQKEQKLSEKEYIIDDVMKSIYEKYGSKTTINYMLNFIKNNNLNYITRDNDARNMIVSNYINGCDVLKLLGINNKGPITENIEEMILEKLEKKMQTICPKVRESKRNEFSIEKEVPPVEMESKSVLSKMKSGLSYIFSRSKAKEQSSKENHIQHTEDKEYEQNEKE